MALSYQGGAWAQGTSDSPTSSPDMARVPVSPSMIWLRDLVMQVIVRQPELAQASSENSQVRERLSEARAARLAQLGISAAAGQESQKLDTRTNNYNDQRMLQLRLAQPLYDAVVGARARQAQAQVYGADWSLVQVREQVMLRTVELYAELVRQSRLTELARENLKLHRQYAGQMKDIARVDLGRASDLSVAQSRVALAESVFASRLQRLEAARVQWRAHTSMPSPEESAVGQTGDVLRDLPQVDVPASMEAAVQEALSVHPSLQKALADVLSAQEGIGLAEAATKPRLGAEFSNRNANNYGGIFGEQQTLYAGLSMQWNFAVSDRYSRRAATEGMRAAQDAVDRQALAVRAMVETQWYEMLASKAALASYRTYADQAQEVTRSYSEQFRIGRRSLLEVLNAENELFTAKSNVVATVIDVQTSQWRLLSLRGLLAEELGL